MNNPVADPTSSAQRVAWRGGAATNGCRVVPVERPVALTYNRTTHAVMLASPTDLEDFALGFSRSEGIIEQVQDILALDIVTVPDGIECRMDLAADRLDALTRRQRRLAGPSGCGLCGLDSLAAAIRPVPPVSDGRIVNPEMILEAMASLPEAQVLNSATRAVHAAAFWTPEDGLLALREDVGRHNALDKLSGAMIRRGLCANEGLILLSSRISVEMVQKAALLGAPLVVAISAPTSLAIEVAEGANITLIGIARSDGFEVFSHSSRIDGPRARHVA